MMIIPMDLGVSWIFWKMIFRNGRYLRTTCWYCCHSSILEAWQFNALHAFLFMPWYRNPVGLNIDYLEPSTKESPWKIQLENQIKQFPKRRTELILGHCHWWFQQFPGWTVLNFQGSTHRIQVLHFLRRSRVVRTAGDSSHDHHGARWMYIW